ncbi:MAG: amidohydrolase, partial [Firmicutes bacterium]|nr:amidohydrolase [Bacillota bacterium]
AVVNSTVLRMADITSLTPDPPGGRFDRDPGGEPNGVLRESALAVLDALGAPDEEELVEAVRLGSRELARRGITSVHEPGVTAPALRALQKARRAGDLVTRVYLMLTPSDEAYQTAFVSTGLATGFGDDWLKVGPLKLMLDGSSSGPTAATREPYASDPRDRGILRLPPMEVKRRFKAAAEAGFQVTAHAVGDLAVETAVEALEALAEVVGDGGPAGSRDRWRHRIEHCAMTDAALRERIKAVGAVPVLQPVFLWEFGDGYVLNYGRERASGMFAAGSFGRAGVRFALSTDCPVTSPDPMLNVFVAVTRRTMSGDTLGPEERLTVAEALEAYTFGGAWAAHEEDLKGSLEPGRLADITVLSGDPFRVSIEETRELRAVMTIVGGKVVHEE